MATNFRIHLVGSLALFAVLVTPLGAQQHLPAHLQANATSPTSVDLSWDAVTGANEYIIQRAVGSPTFVSINTPKISGSTTHYTDASAPAGTTFRYRVKAKYGGSVPPTFSDPVSVTTSGASTSSAAAPTNPASTPGQPVSNEPVSRARDPGLASATTGRTLATVAPSPATPAATPVTDPSGFTATIQGDKVVLKWLPVSGVSWYLVGGPGMGSNGHQVQTTSDTVRGLGPGEYDWTVASLTDDRKPLTNWMNWPKAHLTISPPPPAPVTSGRYRITVAGFKIDHETYDDILQRDGKRDEVYFAAVVQHFNRRLGTLIEIGSVKTKVYGDANGFPDRVPQGHASDLGGLMTGDVVPYGWDEQAMLPPGTPGSFPLVVWEGPLTDAQDALVLRPAVWEWDGDQTAFNYWQRRLTTGKPADTWNIAGVQQSLAATGLSEIEGGLLLLGDNQWYHSTGFGDQGINAGRDRPIGLVDGLWNDRLLVITREKIEHELTKLQTIGGKRGLLPLHLLDSNSGSLVFSGDYTLYLRVERMP